MMTSSNDTEPQLNGLEARLKSVLGDVLGLDPDRVTGFSAETGLFGHIPELDSMAVANLLAELEDRLDIVIDDEDLDGEMMETFGGLLAFAEAKTRAG